MALIDLIVDVNIAATQAAPSLPGTDIPAYIGYHTHWTDRIRTYFDPADMLTDGFTVNDPLYLMAASAFSQSPHINQFKIIRGTTSVAQVMHFKVTIDNTADGAVGQVVGMDLTKPDGTVVTTFHHTVATTETDAQIATALAALTISGLTLAVDGGDTAQVNITVGTSGAIWYPSGVEGGTFHDVTASASPQTDLAAAALIDADFYCVSGAWLSPANISAIATWVDSNARIQAYTTADTLPTSTGGGGIFPTLKATGSNRNYGQYSGTPRTYGAVGLAANRLTDDAGADTWAFVTVVGTPTDALTPSQISAATPLDGGVADNGNVYVSVANTGNTLNGVAASGLFIDLQRGIDALATEIKLQIFTAMRAASAAGKKIPYTRKGATIIKGIIANVLNGFTNSGFLSDDIDAKFVVTVPDIKTVSATDKAKRILRNVNFTCTASNAIQTVVIRGNVTF